MSNSVALNDYFLVRNVNDGAFLGDLCQELGIGFSKYIPVDFQSSGSSLIPKISKNELENHISSLIHDVFGLTEYEPVAHLQEKVEKIAAETFLSIKLGTVPGSNNLSTQDRIADWRGQLIQRSQISLLKTAGWEVIEISEKDNVGNLPLSDSIDSISCFEYALMRANVDKAFPCGFSSAEIPDRLTKHWDFVPVKNPKAGDLVLFLQDDVPVHMGVYYKNKVLSKPGNEQRFAFVHGLEEASRHYGNRVVFFRRSLLS